MRIWALIGLFAAGVMTCQADDLSIFEIPNDALVQSPEPVLYGFKSAGDPNIPTAFDVELELMQPDPVLFPLPAYDDGLPNPPGQLTWFINSLPEHGRLYDPNVGQITEAPYVLLDPNHQVMYEPCPYFLYGPDSFTFSVDDGGIEPEGGMSNLAAVTLQVNFLDQTEAPVYPAGVTTLYPLMAEYEAVRQQVIYPASEIGAAQTLTHMLLDVAVAPGQVLENWTIRIKYTDREVYNRNNRQFDTNGWTIVYQADETITEGLNLFAFQTPFEYNGTDNLLIDFSFFNSTSSTSGQIRSVNMGSSRTLYQRSSTLDKNPLDWTLADFSYLAYLETRVPKLLLWGYDPTGLGILAADFNIDCSVDTVDLERMAQNWGAVWNLSADIEDDSIVNLKDLAILAQQWMAADCESCGGADLTSDGNVDFDDLAIFTDSWFAVEQPDSRVTDLDDDGTTNLADFAILASLWMQDAF